MLAAEDVALEVSSSASLLTAKPLWGSQETKQE